VSGIVLYIEGYGSMIVWEHTRLRVAVSQTGNGYSECVF